MSESDFFEPDDQEVQPKKKGLSGCAIAGIGCGVIVVLLLIVAGIGAWWVSKHGRQLGTDFAVTAMKEGLKELDVPDDQRQRMHARIDEVGQQFKEGKLELQQVGAIFEKLSQSPILPAGVSLFVKRVYIRDSGLDDVEKEAAHLAIQRFSRGVIDESIPEAERESVLDRISTKDLNGNRQFKQKLTDAELRDFIEAVTKAADDAGVAAEVPEINFADEFDKAIDEALGQVGGTALSEPSSSATEPASDAAESAVPEVTTPETTTTETSETPEADPADTETPESATTK